jgi:hypothetical protein
MSKKVSIRFIYETLKNFNFLKDDVNDMGGALS